MADGTMNHGSATPGPVVSNRNAGPGQLLKSERLPKTLWLPNTAKAYRIHYGSTSHDGRRIAVSGAVFIPRGNAPKAGWPVVSWAHGTVGVADVCANSRSGRSQRDTEFLQSWLAAGYAIVATDYEGLGTHGEHAYLNGNSEAYGVIDIVRAAQQLHEPLSEAWLSVGQSQGAQATLFTGATVRRYAPELDYRGSVGTAPTTQWRLTASVAKPFDPETPANPSVLLILAGLRTTHPDFDPAGYLTPFGQQLLAAAMDTTCFTAIAQQLAGRPSTDVFAVDAAEEARLLDLLESDAEIPIVRHSDPVFLGQGTADLTSYPPATALTAEKLRAVGNDVTFKFYQGADHGGVMAAAKADILAWAADRMR
ncbi:lipase family protein [Kribbella albertanoniae]|uniref:lipase family protein n=1 Tax=Kribbella albertanoniae TaxID=1266829 RepID=UPI00140555F7|nr:lipase family protein [Kribbella albertanoniae]